MIIILDFIKEFYYLILLALFVVILALELVILLIKKKDPSVLSGLNAILPRLVKAAEDKYGSGNGEVKLEYVFRYCQTYLSDFYNIKNLDPYAKYISDKIDEILSCPQKKGV